MRKTMKKNLISVFALVAAASIPVGFMSMQNKQVGADTAVPTASEFYMQEGAAVRTTSDELGIRFGATITQAYWQDLQAAYGADATYDFYSIVTDGTKPIRKSYEGLTPLFEEEETYTFYSTIIYNTQELIDSGLLEAACNLSLTASTYIDITLAGETEPTVTLTAYGETGERSMKAVANAAILAGETDEDLLNYFTVGNRSETAEGYVFQDDSGFIEMAGLPDLTDTTDMEVYYGAQKVDASYADGVISFSGTTLKDGRTQADVSVFTDGKVYSSKVAKATKITQANATDLLSLTGGETVYLAEDIDLAGIEWNTAVAFSGVFEGNNYAIKNLTTVTGNGFFNTMQGIIRNVAFVDAFTGGNSAVIANKPTGGLLLENVFIDISGRDGWSGATLYTAGSAEFAANMTNVVVNFPAAQTNYNLFGYILKGLSTLTNVHVISGSGVYARENDASKNYIKAESTTYFHSSAEAFAMADKDLTGFLDDCVAEYLNLVTISQANVTDLLSLKGNETVILMEDIDLAGIEWNTTAAFSGVFEGNNHSIKNLMTVDGKGFFNTAQGTIRNVAFVDAFTGGNSAVIANKPTGALLLENVFIDITGRGGWSGATLYTAGSAEFAANMTNVVVNFPAAQTNYNLFGYILKGASTLTNVHVISGSGVYARMNDDSKKYVKAESTVSFHADLATFATANASLTEFLNDCVTEYLNIVKISQTNVTDLLTVTNQTVVLTEDIDLAGIEWNTTAAFSGVFDGGNHKIKNLTTVTGKGFFNTVQGTIKNVAFVDAFTGGNSAVIANKPTGALLLENVFIDISGRGGWSGATLYTAGSAEFAANMTNVVVNFPAAQTNYNLFGYTLKGASTLTNVHVISGSGVYARMNDASKVYVKAGSTVTFHTDMAAFGAANTTLTDFLDDCVAEYFNIVKIRQANVADLLTVTGQSVYLMEDVNLTGIAWNSTAVFTGVFEGNNHAIKNLTVVANNGFFKNINGAKIRNVAFVDVTLASNAGVITYRPSGALTMENTFIEVKATGSGGRLGAICERSTNAVALNLTNVVISMPKTNANEAIFGYTLKGTSKLTNVHCIGLANATASVANVSPQIASGSSYYLHTSLDVFNSATKTLTDFLTSCVASYLNA